MPSPLFAADLALYGPRPGAVRAPSRAEARDYCRRLARSHYENFTVASWLLPRALRPHFYHIYAYCRWADDLADETPAGAQALALLDWWGEQLAECYAGRATHPVFVALGETIAEFDIPQAPFEDLLSAFRQDQRVTRYVTLGELLDYCRRSANPVGRLVLYLWRSFDAERAALADQVCTGLQLANFWQDVADDWRRGRVYIPREALEREGIDEGELAREEATPALRRALATEVARADGFLRRGWPLVTTLPARLRVDMALFIEGGLAILERIRRVDYDVWRRRPALSRGDQARLFARSVWRGLVRGGGP